MDKEQFEEWRANPGTVEVFKEVTSVREALKEALAKGATLGDEVHTARIVGNIEGLDQVLFGLPQLLNIKYEEAGDEE